MSATPPRKSGLGRGLGALLGNAAPDLIARTAEDLPFHYLTLDQIVSNRYQPRSSMDDESLQALADSIREQGVLQPIVVRPRTAGGYELIAGERRWRACQKLALKRIPAVVQKTDDATSALMALVENLQREDLNPMEEARALQRLADEFSMTHQQIGQRLGRSRAAISNALRLNALDGRVQQALEHGDISMGHARALLPLSLPDQCLLAEQIIEQGWSVRETERKVKTHLKAGQTAPQKKEPSADLQALQDRVSDALGTEVHIRTRRHGGQLLIRYHDLDQLDGLLARMQISDL